jgi:hypothetical protein
VITEVSFRRSSQRTGVTRVLQEAGAQRISFSLYIPNVHLSFACIIMRKNDKSEVVRHEEKLDSE